MHFKNFEGKPERESPKRTISASGRLGPLQMVLESDIKRCASEAEPRKEVDTRRYASKNVGPRRGCGLWDPTSIGEENECQRGH